jgi:hypothetical protein
MALKAVKHRHFLHKEPDRWRKLLTIFGSHDLVPQQLLYQAGYRTRYLVLVPGTDLYARTAKDVSIRHPPIMESWNPDKDS